MLELQFLKVKDSNNLTLVSDKFTVEFNDAVGPSMISNRQTFTDKMSKRHEYI